jgi:hypothetical protein
MKTNVWKYYPFIVAFSLLFFVSACGDDDGDSEVIPENDISIKSISPDSPATLDHYQTSSNDRVKIKYDYNITHAEGARIWIRPYTDGSPSPGYLYSKSSVFDGKGSRDVLVSIDEDAGTVKVDQLKIIISNPDQTEDIRERFIEVDYTCE